MNIQVQMPYCQGIVCVNIAAKREKKGRKMFKSFKKYIFVVLELGETVAVMAWGNNA